MSDAKGPPAGTPLGDLVAARMRDVEIALLSRVLATTLAQALPASRVQVERRRTIIDVARRRPGVVVGVTVTGPDRVLALRVLDTDRLDASVAHVVGGVSISRRDVSVAQWLDELAVLLNRAAAQDEATRQALRCALLP